MVKQKLFLLFFIIGLLPHIAIAQNQNFKPLVDSAWTAINTQYLDTVFNGVDWPGLRHELLAKDYFVKEEAYAAIEVMLKRLNDPATRFLTKDGASGFVLDLRNNPGGFVPACQEVAGIFLGPKPIAKVLGRGNILTDLQAQGEKLTDKPVAVLVNEGTASAAEVVAGALQDGKRAIVVGTRTFGKGLVHGAQQLADSSALMITVGRLRTLKGRDILNDAIMPDEVVAAPESPILNPSRGEPASHQDVQYLRAVEILLKGQNGLGQNY